MRHMIPPFHATALLLCAGLSSTAATAGSQVSRPLPPDPVPPLLADDGSAMPASRHLPAAEAAAGGRAPGWATPAQREQLQRLHPERVVRLRAAEGSAPSKLDPAAWVFVEGRGETAVRLARRLSEAGIEQVWVMLPASGRGTKPVPHIARGERE